MGIQHYYNDMPYHVWNPFTNMREFFLMLGSGSSVITRGEGPYVYNNDGKRYINGFSSLWNVGLGFGRQEIVDAVTKQLQELPYASCFRQVHPKAIELAARLVELTEGRYQHVYLGTNGSEATETAIKIARQYHRQSANKKDSERYKIVSVAGSYHGVSYGAMSTSGAPEDEDKFGPLVSGFLHIPAPYCYRCTYSNSPSTCGLECALELERVIQAEGETTIAAFILEPIMGVAGIISPPDRYYEKISQICSASGVLLIADEVSTGFGRTGRLFATEDWTRRPDMLCVAKAISNGYLPLSATLVTGEIFERFLAKGNQFNHGSTASGHPACAAAGLASIDILLRERLSENAEKIGNYLLAKLRKIMDGSRIVGDVRGKGLMIGIELVEDKESKVRLDVHQAKKVAFMIADNGLIIHNNNNNIIGLFPPLIIDEALADEMIGILEKVLCP